MPAARIAAAAFLLFFATVALAAPTFPKLTGRVVDGAQMLSPASEEKLTAELAALEAKTGHQLVVATVPDLQGYEIEEYGNGLLRTWALGRKDVNDGAILLVAPNQRKVRVEVGYGLEPVLTDALSRIIIERKIIPAFKAGDMEAGVVAGAGALVEQLGLPEGEAKAQVAAADVQPAAASNDGPPIPVIVIIVILFWIITGVLRAFGRRGRGGGGRGLWWLLPMILSSSSRGGGGGWSGGGGSWGGGGGGGGFSGGGGSGGGGGASGSW